MIYEKKLSSFSELSRELSILDLDAGIRTTGKYNGKKCYLFVTRSANGFTSLLYSMKLLKKESLPDKRLLAREFEDQGSLETFLAQIVNKPVKAVSY